MNFRRDAPIKAKRKACRCDWCGEPIKVGEPAVYTSGMGEDFYAGSMHPECWRAEHWWWKLNPGWGDSWFTMDMARGRAVESDGERQPIEFRADPVTKEEVARPHDHAEAMKLQSITA